MKHLLLYILVLLPALAIAQDKANADAAYRSKDYQKAIELYEKDLEEGGSAETYHNLGNAYFRSGNIPKAILNYEKASKIAPSDESIRHSLDFSRKKTTDNLPAESSFFLAEWFYSICSFMTIDGWAVTAIVALVLAMAFFLAYLFMHEIRIRKIAFYSSVVLIIAFILSNIFAWQKKSLLTSHDEGIIMTPTVTLRVSPKDDAKAAFDLHEGTKVFVTDSEIQGWYEVRLSDGRKAWITSNDVSLI